MKGKEEAYTLNDLLGKVSNYIKSKEDIDIIEKAYDFA